MIDFIRYAAGIFTALVGVFLHCVGLVFIFISCWMLDQADWISGRKDFG